MLRDTGRERGDTRSCLTLHPAADRSRLLVPALSVVQLFMQHSFNAKGTSALGSGMKTIFPCLAVGHQRCGQGCLLLSLISWHLHSSQQKSPVAAVHLSCLTSEVKRNQRSVMCTQESRIRLIFNFAMLVLLQF